MTARRLPTLPVIVAFLGMGLLLGLVPGHAASLDVDSQRLTPYRTCIVTATPTITTTVRDATVRQGSPASNFGALTTNNVTSAVSNRRLYVRFDLTGCTPAIPASATIRLATLRLFVTSMPSVCRTIDIFRVTAAWTEAGLTWNNQPFGTAINNPSAGSATDTFTMGTPVACENRASGVYIVGATPTADVAAFVAGTAPNYGWMLRDNAEGSGTARTQTLSAKELGSILRAPQLVVTYVVVP